MTKPSFEQEVKQCLADKGVSFLDKSDSFRHPDFTILLNGSPYFHLEVKEKRQAYNMKNWPRYIDEPDLFILDDLTVRKCLAYAPRSGVVIRDNLRGLYSFFSIVDLALMPRRRLNRRIERSAPSWKGKWLINLKHGLTAKTLEEIFSGIRQYVEASDRILFEIIECYGRYEGEMIGRGGITRRPADWDTDIGATR
ncbi:MAG: hypothetical protein HXY42_05755 [Chloroflexi bacterium]|jgi:hypothetical protein|nr:hypothetical protein [Chloroflexota bacterium]